MSDNDNAGKKPELTTAMQIGNLTTGMAWCYFAVMAAVWTVRTWLYQRQHGKQTGMPRSVSFLAANGWTFDQVAALLKEYHVNYCNMWEMWTVDYGAPVLEHSILVMPSQYDYADGILAQHAIIATSLPGKSRGYTIHPPRQRQPEQRLPARRRAKLGKTYS